MNTTALVDFFTTTKSRLTTPVPIHFMNDQQVTLYTYYRKVSFSGYRWHGVQSKPFLPGAHVEGPDGLQPDLLGAPWETHPEAGQNFVVEP